MKWLLRKLDLAAEMAARTAGTLAGIAMVVCPTLVGAWALGADLSWLSSNGVLAISIAAFLGAVIGASTKT